MNSPRLAAFDVAVLVLYLVGVAALGCWFLLKRRGADSFMTGGRNLPAWVVGLSIFGTFVSSISFLALPGKAYTQNWNAFVFSLTLPVAALIAVRYFVPFFRRDGVTSAYQHLETRFGGWARAYASTCYILTQMGRTGTILYLLALPLEQLLGWDVRWTIVGIGLLTTIYTMVGGIEGVIWTDVMQSVVLIAGALLCVVLIPLQMAEGPGQLFEIAARDSKFSLGSTAPSLTEPTVWVVLAYGLVINLQNFGIDQSYVQRYLTAKSDRAARRSVWLGALSYIPVSACFLFIGTGLYALYLSRPDELPEGVTGDRVFPYYMVTKLPPGCAGLLIAAVFAAAMSTISTSLNCSATLTLTDFYRRSLRPAAGERESLLVLYGSTLLWGVIGTGAGLAMIGVKAALDAWWNIAGALSGGMLGLFLLGYLTRRVSSLAAFLATLAGITLIVWLSFSRSLPEEWDAWRSPFEPLLTIVFGTFLILVTGLLLSRLFPRESPGPYGPGL
jgi:SSS family solute:Na+ symporter